MQIYRLLNLFSFLSCLSELLRNIRTQVLIKLIKPYTRIHIPFISKVLIFMDLNTKFVVINAVYLKVIFGNI